MVATSSGPVVLRAQGNLYLLEIESEAGGLDWLARVILSVTARPQRVSDLMRCFGLPRRLLEDAIGHLIEDHLLLIDVARGQVRASGLPLSTHTTRPAHSSVLVWQDYVTGSIFPWEWIRPFCDRDRIRAGEDIKDLLGGPPRKYVLEMSDAELLTHLERFRPGASWAEVIVRRERVERRATMFVNAESDAQGRLTIFDQVPSSLVRQWGRFAPVGFHGMQSGYRIELPEAWSAIVASWTADTMNRVADFKNRKEPDPTTSRRLLGRIREVVERYSKLELIEDAPPLLRQRVQESSGGAPHHRLVVATSDVHDSWSDALPIFRMSHAEQRYVLLATDKLKDKHVQVVQTRGGDVEVSSRLDVELVLLNDRELWVGGVQQNRRLALCLRAARPLQPLLAWLPHAFAWDAVSLGRSQLEDHVRAYSVLRDALALDEGLRELETTPSEQPPAEELIARLRHDVEEIEKALNALDPHEVTAIDAAELFDALEERQGARLLLRHEKSPLCELSTRHEVVIWSTQKPSPPFRWLQEPGLCEVAIVEDVVVFGWWSYAGTRSELPPFIAVHAPSVAAALRARSDKATVVKQ